MTSSSASAKPSAGALPVLSAMMFLQFFVWGAWYVPVTGWLNDMGLGGLTVWVFSVCPIAAIVSPIFLGMIADRFFASQKVLGILHLVGAVFMFLIPTMITKDSVAGTAPTSFWHPCVLLMLGHALCYMPTLALSSSVALAHLTSVEKQFPIVRVSGTIGWIIAGLVVSMLLPGGDKSPWQFYLVGIAGVALGFMSFALPNTPPPLAGKKVGVGQLLGLDAISLLKNPQFALFMLCSLLICIPLSGYYQQARNFVDFSGLADPAFKMTFGQMSEVFFMAIMPLIIVRLGVKKMLLFGMLAWVARYGLFALGAPDKVAWMVIGGILLHGICYDFFFVAGQIYVDKDTPHEVRGQAQSFFVLITQGVGMLIGAQAINWLVGKSTTITETVGGAKEVVFNWQQIWFWPAMFAAVIAVIFFVFFKEKKAAGAK
ncbi:nucleoside transporter [Ereboglobus sp. PH5-5]|uniref:MFS transporter n=1 Tax=Ereboglobus sp. PH5-5 TaxID=2940529 RepID=UPI00240613B5|nr:MFS transporter [Ereboglobus sp. PH5-5]MDF9833573.1 nucleoside transporter [Ereboglobus sp. PH5-5]